MCDDDDCKSVALKTEYESSRIGSDAEKQINFLLEEHKRNVLERLESTKNKLRIRMCGLIQDFKTNNEEVKRLKTKIVLIEDQWIADFISSQIVRSADKLINSNTLHMLNHHKVYQFEIPKNKKFEQLFAKDGFYTKPMTVNMVNESLAKSKLQFLGINDKGIVSFMF